MKKICFVAPVPVTIFLYNRELIKHARSQGWEVSAVFSGGTTSEFGGHDYQSVLADMGVHIHNVPMCRRISLLKDLWCVARLWWFFLRHRFDIVHTSNTKAILLMSIATSLACHPHHVATVHGRYYEITTGRKRRFRVLLDKLAHALSERTIAVSHSLRDAMVRDGIGDKESLVVIGNGSCCGIDATEYSRESVDESEVQALRDQCGLTQDDRVLLNIGRVRRDKGINELVSAFLRLQSDFPDWHLVIVGHEEHAEPVDHNILKAISEEPRIHRVQWLSDPRIGYALSDIFVFPTWREGFGNVAMEAAAMGVPVVVAESVGAVDTLVDKETGLLFKTKDVDGLTESLRCLMQSPELRQRMGQAGRKRMIEDFSERSITLGHFDLYDDVLTGACAKRCAGDETMRSTGSP